MISIFQRFYREICLVLLAVFGLACGYLLSTVLETTMIATPLAQVKPSPVSKTSLAAKTRDDLNFIVQHNLFDPASRGSKAPGFSLEEQNGGKSQAALRTDLVLLGTMVSGSSSTALIRTGRDTALYRLEEEIPGGGQIEVIERKQVTLRNPDQSTTVLSTEGVAEATQPQSVSSSTAADAGIRAVDERQWKISRTAAESARENIGDQLRLAQIEPRLVDGRTDGFVIMKLNSRSLLNKMGLKRGDVIKQVNTLQLDSPEKALQVLQQLREARLITVDILRNNESMTLNYELE